MKLIRFGQAGKEKPGVQLENGKRIDITAFGQDYNEDFFGNDGIKRLREWLLQNEEKCPEISHEVRLEPPFVRPSQLTCVGPT